MFPDVLRVSSFPDRFPNNAWAVALSAHSDFVTSRVYVCLGATCHLHFWQNERGLLRAIGTTTTITSDSHKKETHQIVMVVAVHVFQIFHQKRQHSRLRKQQAKRQASVGKS